MQRKKRNLAILTIFLALSGVFSQFLSIDSTQAAGTTTGRVFHDFNGNYSTTAAIKLDSFAAFGDGSSVSLKWSTGGEAGNLGFNVYRETNGERELLTAAPIAGSALRSSIELIGSGENYSWTDAEPKRGAVYYLEDLDIDGTKTLHGPISPTFQIFIDKFERKSALLSDLTRSEGPSAEKEIVGEREPESASFNQAVQWQIAAQNGVKITVNHDGWYHVSSEQLQSAGFDTSSNRENWQLFCNTDQIPLKVNYDDSIEFFGRGVDTAYTDKQVYYLIKGGSTGLRISPTKAGPGEENPVQSFRVAVERKDRSIYVSALLNGNVENWFGAVINGTVETLQNLTVNKFDASQPARLSVRLQGLTANGHMVSVKFNNVDLGVVNFGSPENREFQFDIPASSLIEGANSVRLQSVGAGNDVSLTDTVRLSYARRYEALGNKIHFSVPAGETASITGFSTEKFNLYEIQNGQVARQIFVERTRNDYSFGFDLERANYNREFLALQNTLSEQPALIERNFASSWYNPSNQAVFVIIAPTILQNQASSLAAIRQNQGLQTRVVLTEDIADEFGAGVLTSEAVKQFLQNAVTNWAIKPKYALLFGDSSFDERNYLGQANRNLVPTRLFDTAFMETSNDGWMADFNNDGIENIAIGRLPAANAAEANVMLAKLMRYDSQNRPAKTDVIVTDSGFEVFSNGVQANLPNNVQAVRIDRSTMTDAQMRSRILTEMNISPTVVTYTGHGTMGVWSSATIFTNNDASALYNPQLSFYMLMTCLNGFSHNTSGESVAEAALKAENGGAVAVWASSGIIVAVNQAAMSENATSLVFRNNPLRIGDILRQAKLNSTDQDVRRTWQLFGDPTIFVR